MAGKQNAATEGTRKTQAAGGGCAAVGSAPKLDRLIHERLRLGILSALSVNESLTFNELKKLLDTTDGNLSVHARKLEEAGYLTCHQVVRRPRAAHRLPLTPAGRRALERYLDHMEALIQAMRDEVRRSLFLCLLTLNRKVLCTPESSWMATAAGPWRAGCRGSPGTAPAWKPSRRVVEAAPEARHRHPHALRVLLRQLAPAAGGSGGPDAPDGVVPGTRDRPRASRTAYAWK